jgi:hypothetical protein
LGVGEEGGWRIDVLLPLPRGPSLDRSSQGGWRGTKRPRRRA